MDRREFLKFTALASFFPKELLGNELTSAQEKKLHIGTYFPMVRRIKTGEKPDRHHALISDSFVFDFEKMADFGFSYAHIHPLDIGRFKSEVKRCHSAGLDHVLQEAIHTNKGFNQFQLYDYILPFYQESAKNGGLAVSLNDEPWERYKIFPFKDLERNQAVNNMLGSKLPMHINYCIGLIAGMQKYPEEVKKYLALKGITSLDIYPYHSSGKDFFGKNVNSIPFCIEKIRNFQSENKPLWLILDSVSTSEGNHEWKGEYKANELRYATLRSIFLNGVDNLSYFFFPWNNVEGRISKDSLGESDMMQNKLKPVIKEARNLEFLMNLPTKKQSRETKYFDEFMWGEVPKENIGVNPEYIVKKGNKKGEYYLIVANNSSDKVKINFDINNLLNKKKDFKWEITQYGREGLPCSSRGGYRISPKVGLDSYDVRVYKLRRA